VEVCVLKVMSETGQPAFLLAHLKQFTKARSQVLGEWQWWFLLLGHENCKVPYKGTNTMEYPVV
jgi:hypothetical protein